MAFGLAVVLASGVASAGDHEPVAPARVAAGLSEVPFSVANEMQSNTIACGASIAHWFSMELGRAAPGVRLETSLWADAKSGTVFILNGHGDRLPVERLWCGLEGRSWQTRAPIELARRAGEAQAPIRLACTAVADGRLACDPR